jgi:hypothetical protein
MVYAVCDVVILDSQNIQWESEICVTRENSRFVHFEMQFRELHQMQ